MITKDLLQCQVIIFIASDNVSKILSKSGKHVTNINYALKNVKSNTVVNFICSDQRSLIITTNNITSMLDLDIIEKYMKNIEMV